MSQFQSKKIVDVLRMIQNYDLVLPPFQREYVWKPEQVERLFDSLMKGYPINSMLFWKVGMDIKQNYRFYKMLDLYIEDNRTHNDLFPDGLKDSFYAIIDGQQRLTSLNLGLRGSYAYRKKYAWARLSENNYPTRHLYLNLSSQLTEDEGGMTYDFEWIDQKISMQQDMYIDSNGHKWFRVGKVLDFADEMKQRLFYRNNDMTLEEESVLTRLYRIVFDDQSINYYEVDAEEPNVAVDVFVRTNSGGTTLNYADILLSITIANWEERGVDARTEIYGLIDRINKDLGFNITHDYVLKAFLYLFGRDVKMQITSFNNTLLDEIGQEWNQVRSAILSTFALLKDYGLDNSRLSSNYATLPILYYLYWTSKYKGIVDAPHYEGERLIIKRWLLKTLLLKTFGYRSDWALRLSRKVLQGGEWPSFPANEIEMELKQNVSDKEFYDTVLGFQSENRQAWVVLSLLFSHKTFENTSYDIDHCHPCAAWTEELCQWEEYNSIVNLQLLPRPENIRKKDKPLDMWVGERLSKISIDREAFLHSQLFPDIDLSVQNFREFYNERKKILIDELKKIL